MSGQWEIVGKGKKDKQTGKTKKLTKDEKKKFVDNAPKVEDLLPLAQVKTLYSALDTNKEPSKPVEKAVKTKENEAKKAQKKPKEKKEPAVKDNKPPKTIEAAVALITTADVQNVLEVGQLRFPAAPLVWLKGLASWLNTKLPVDHTDHSFMAKSWEHPLCLLSADTRSVLKKALKEVPESAVQMFFDYCLTSMANDMTKGGPVTGYKMLLQLVASQVPSVAVASLDKSATLRHSYQNRAAIGCSIMWALGQAGFKDLAVGLQVWQTVMVPVYELRSYTQFVSDYLKHLVARHSTSKALTAAQYLTVLDCVASAKQGQMLAAHVHSLQGILCNAHPEDRLHSLFLPLLSRLSLSSPPAIKNQVVEFLTHCLAKDSQSFSVWRNEYTRHLPHSAILLRHLNSAGKSLPARLLKDTIKTFKVTNDDLVKQKLKSEGLQECTRLCDAFLGKAAEGRSFPWKRVTLLIVLAVAGVIAYDVNTHNGFNGSKTGVFLKDVGALQYGEQAVARLQESYHQAYRWTEQNLPQVKRVLTVVREWAVTLALQVVAAGNLLVEACLPYIHRWMREYAPRLQEALSLWLSQLGHFCLESCTLLLKYLALASEWLRDNVFVGNLSPENLQRVTLEAINTTQTLAAQTISWINGKMVAASPEKSV